MFIPCEKKEKKFKTISVDQTRQLNTVFLKMREEEGEKTPPQMNSSMIN